MKIIRFKDQNGNIHETAFFKGVKGAKGDPGPPGSGSITGDYEDLLNRPQIEGVTLSGNKTFEELNLEGIGFIEIDSLFV